jgi:hypothetical protein
MGRNVAATAFRSDSRDFSAKIACALGFLGSLFPLSNPQGISLRLRIRASLGCSRPQSPVRSRCDGSRKAEFEGTALCKDQTAIRPDSRPTVRGQRRRKALRSTCRTRRRAARAVGNNLAVAGGGRHGDAPRLRPNARRRALAVVRRHARAIMLRAGRPARVARRIARVGPARRPVVRAVRVDAAHRLRVRGGAKSRTPAANMARDEVTSEVSTPRRGTRGHHSVVGEPENMG